MLLNAQSMQQNAEIMGHSQELLLQQPSFLIQEEGQVGGMIE